MGLLPNRAAAVCVLRRQFFVSGKVLPVERGKGVLQPVVDLVSEQLARGKWVHVFPEARIVYTGQLGRFKWGIGRMICVSRRRSGGR